MCHPSTGAKRRLKSRPQGFSGAGPAAGSVCRRYDARYSSVRTPERSLARADITHRGALASVVCKGPSSVAAERSRHAGAAACPQHVVERPNRFDDVRGLSSITHSARFDVTECVGSARVGGTRCQSQRRNSFITGNARSPKSNIAWFSQALPLVGSSGSQPLPGTAVQVASQ